MRRVAVRQYQSLSAERCCCCWHRRLARTRRPTARQILVPCRLILVLPQFFCTVFVFSEDLVLVTSNCYFYLVLVQYFGAVKSAFKNSNLLGVLYVPVANFDMELFWQYVTCEMVSLLTRGLIH